MTGAAILRSTVVVLAGMLCICALADSARADNPRDHVLWRAIRHGDLALLESQLREGAPVNVHASDGTTPLMLAALHGSPEMVKALLDRGADPNAVDKRRRRRIAVRRQRCAEG